jgi:NDP-sugar pyrophosphorylase family protein/aminoglycoside/choline kinase family phosphotransferase
MRLPRKAVVLAAGLGARLKPLSLVTPKPLLPVWGTPAIDHMLALLSRFGVREVLVNLHFGADAIFRHLRRCAGAGLRITASFEPELLGTAGVLRRADWFPGDEPFWMANADVLADLSPEPLLRAFRREQALAVLWLHPTLGPRTVETDGLRITSFRSRSPGAPGTATFCGFQLLSPTILDFVPTGAGESSIITSYESAQRAGHTVLGVTVPRAFWADVGTPHQYLQAHAAVLAAARRHAAGRRLYHPPCRAPRLPARAPGAFCALGAGVRLAPGALVRNAVIGDGAVLGPRARVVDAIVAPGARVNRPVPWMALPAEGLPLPALSAALTRLGWRAADTTVLPLPPRGSARSFTRLAHDRRSAMLVCYSLERAENGLYARHAAHLRQVGLRVPAVLHDCPAQQWTLFEDVEAPSLEDRYHALSNRALDALYDGILDEMALLHGPATRAARRGRWPLCAPFAPRLLEWEHNLFLEQYVQRHTALDAPAQDALRRELRRLTRLLAPLPRVLVHRDFQSSNVLLPRGGPVLIDFQGMRFGPAEYDLASLLADPYVELTEERQQRLYARYARLRPDFRARPTLLWAAVLQRLIQAMGAYGRLSANPDTARFARYFDPGLRMMRRALAHLDGFPRLRECTALPP